MSIAILLIGGLLVKIQSFIIKILFTRTIGEQALSLYTIAVPTYSLMVALATFALPISISKLISEEKFSEKKILISSFFLVLLLEGILVITFYKLSHFIAINFLKQNKVAEVLQAMVLTLSFISFSSIFKGYFLGKMKVFPNTLSNIIEQNIRIFFLLFILPKITLHNSLKGLFCFILLSIITESISCFIFLLFLPKKIFLQKERFIPSKKILSSILETSIPCVSSRLIGNIGFFLEPIILTNLLLINGYSNSYILQEYTSYHAYALGLLTLPSFFISAIDQILIPEISKHAVKNNKKMLKKRLQQALSYAFLIGLISSLGILLTKNYLLNLLYKTSSGSIYISLLAPIFVLFYLEAPIISAMQAIGLAKTSFKISLIGTILKLGILAILSTCHVGLYSLVFAEIFNIFFVVFLNGYFLKHHLILNT